MKKMININSFFDIFKGRQENLKVKRVFEIWDELVECQKIYKHKIELGKQLLVQADKVNDLPLSIVEKIGRKNIFLSAAKDHFDAAEPYAYKIKTLSAELRLAIDEARC